MDGPGKGWSKGKQYVPRQSCEVCAGAFYAPPSQIIRGGGKFCSVACRTRFRASRPSTFPQGSNIRGVGGKRADLGDMYFRSRWEANYARYLNWLQKLNQIERWEYEVDTFEFPVIRGSKYYTPDFKIFENGEHRYAEIKGYMDQRSLTKLKRMAKYFPGERIDVIRENHMRSIEIAIGPLLTGWEKPSPAKRAA